jgi:uncharacterized protein YegL
MLKITDNKMEKKLDIDLAENPETRCPVVLLLDTSKSMEGESIDNLNKGIRMFIEEVKADAMASLSVEVCIITFNTQVTIYRDFTSVDKLNFEDLKTGGMTSMHQAIDLGLTCLEQRKESYKENYVSYYRPWLLLITDGRATDENSTTVERIRKAEKEEKIISHIVGVGDNFDKEQLKSFTKNPVIKLKNVEFSELFEWLSSSVSQVSRDAGYIESEHEPISLGQPLI